MSRGSSPCFAISLGSKSFKIHRGVLQGRHFRYPPSSQGYSCFTPGVLKEAVFELLLNRISQRDYEAGDYAFFDLLAGSGQMALEALSLGFQKVYISEIDALRIAHIKKQLGYEQGKGAPAPNLERPSIELSQSSTELSQSSIIELSRSSIIEIYCRDFRRMSPLIYSHLQSVLYFDLPYSFWQVKKSQKNPLGVEGFLLRLEKSLVEIGGHTWIFIQGPRFFEPQKLKSVKNLEFRRYGRQHLSFWLSSAHKGGERNVQ